MKNRRSLFATWRFVYLLSSWPEIRFAKCCEFRILAVDFLSFVVARPDDYPSFTYATWWANENSLPTSGLPMFWFWIPFEKMVAFSSIFKPQFSLSHNLRHRGSPLVFLTTMNRDPFLILSFLTSVQKQGSSPEGCCHCGHTQPFQLALFSNQLCRRGRWVSPQLGFLVTYSRSFQWTLLHLSVQDDSCWYLSARLPWWKFCDNIRIIHVFVKQKKTAHSVGGGGYQDQFRLMVDIASSRVEECIGPLFHVSLFRSQRPSLHLPMMIRLAPIRWLNIASYLAVRSLANAKSFSSSSSE